MSNVFDSAFDKESRYISLTASIYFGGSEEAPLDVTRDNYLMDFSLLEELASDAKNPVGNISSNECTFTLFNEDDIFNPKNVTGPYAGKIQSGLRIVVTAREEESMQDTNVGTFYVTSWLAGLYKGYANIECTDKLGSILKLTMPSIDVHQDESVYAFFQRIFYSIGLTDNDFVIDTSLQKVYIPFTYSKKGTVGENLQALAVSYMCNIFTNRVNQIEVLPILNTTEIITEVSSDNQLMDIDLEQSVLKTYTGARLTYALPHIGDCDNILSLPTYDIASGINQLKHLDISKGPVVLYSYCSIDRALKSRLTDAEGTPWDITLTITNSGVSVEQVDINIFGRLLTNNYTVLTTEISSNTLESTLEVTTDYIQTKELATQYLQILKNYISSDIPFITVEARGNLSLDIGSVVTLKDIKHNLSFTAKVYRADYKYDGSLSATYVFLNLTDLGGEAIGF